MRSDTDHKEQLDDFSFLLKQKLEDHRLPVDDLCWEEIELHMKPRRRSMLWWISSSVAAAVIAVMSLLLPFQQEEMPAERLSEQMTPKETVMPEDVVSMEETVTPADKTSQPCRLIAAITRQQPVAEENEAEEQEIEEAVTEQETDQPAEPEKRNEPKKQKQQDLNHYDSKKYKFVSRGKEEKKRKDWSVNASFGTGGHVSLGLSGDDAYHTDYQPGNDGSSGINPPTPPIVLPPFNNGEIVPPDEYTDIDCALPLSFGLTVRKDFSRYIGVETGLVYTYLSSRMTKGGQTSYSSRLELHYLGVPVNLVVNLWNNPRWNIYLSGGMMLEKGLRSKLRQERLSICSPETLVQKEGIDGVQWSLNFSAGVSYRLHKEWSIYFEPRLSGYFDNDQPVSIRTENSVIVGLGAGFRFAF